MKVLLFTHSQDIDGIGSIVLAQEAFSKENVVYVPCKTFEITSKVMEYYKNGKFDDYDFIFVTDLCIKEPLLSIIDSDEKNKNKFKVLDHHKTEIEEGNDNYSFVDIIVEKDGIKECGTSLFYKYLVNNNYLNVTDFYDDFTELVRQYDVWDWEKNNNERARELNILFEVLGIDEYLSIIDDIKQYKCVYFNEKCKNVINEYNDKLNFELEQVYSSLRKKVFNIDGEIFTMGLVNAKYKLRNEIPNYIEKKDSSIDIVGINVLDGETISYRNINKNIDCAKIAEKFGGKGHKNAATSPKMSFMDYFQNVSYSKIYKK